ncbi:MAG: peptidylprolyl isomerase, partial [Candidatus Kapaibacteriota bacterium]
MGAITKIRQVSPYFLATVAVLFIAFMVIQDSSCSTIRDASQSPENVVIADVNGVGITQAEYERRVRITTDRQRQSNPEQEIDDESIRQQVFTQMIDEVLRAEAAKQLGISVTADEIVDVMVRNPPQELQFFKDSTGTFDRELHVRLFTNPDELYNLLINQGAQPEEAQRQRDEWKANLIEIEDYVRTQKLEEALRAAVGAAASVPSPALARENYRTNNSTADIRFVALSADAIGDDAVTVSDADIAAYYEKNKAYYIQKPARQLAYTLLRIQPSAKDTARALRRSQKLMELLNQQPTPQKRADIFQSEMRNGGQAMDFTPSSNIDPSVLTILKSLNAGDVFGPLTTAQGIQYVRLDERRSGTTPKVRASHILIEFGT